MSGLAGVLTGCPARPALRRYTPHMAADGPVGPSSYAEIARVYDSVCLGVVFADIPAVQEAVATGVRDFERRMTGILPDA